MAREYFQALSAGGGDPEVVAFLWRTQYTRRKLLIRALFDAVEENPSLLGELPPLKAARAILKEAETSSPTEVDSLILHPHVGGWAAYTLRREHGGTVRHGDNPLWVDFGGIQVLCLVAAMRANLPWQTRLPHRDGRVLMFGLGMAVFPGLSPDQHIDAETAEGRITLRAGGTTVVLPSETDTAHWWGLRELRADGDVPLSVMLDDLDPFRDLADPVPPSRLSEANVAIWRELFAEAWKLLCEHHRDAAASIAAGVVSLAPLPLGDGRETRSASSGEAFGSIMMSQPPEATTLAVSLVHEFQHIKLGGLMHLMRLTTDEDIPQYYAPWRDDPRPLGGLLQGVYAFFAIAAFWRRHRETVSGVDERLANFEYAYARTQTYEALRIAQACDALTSQGRQFIEGLVAQVEPWFAEELDSQTATAARIVTDHHRTGWRIRHQRMSERELGALVNAWHDGKPASVAVTAPKVAAAPAVRWSQGMVGLVRRHIAAPDTWQTFGGPNAAWWQKTISSADVAVVDGRVDVAQTLYAETLRKDREDLDAWSGLTLALSMGGAEPAARALQRRPEVVKAVYSAIDDKGLAQSPVQVAAWLGEAMR